ncbi:MAG: RES family NAD+ phosphorylase [Actinomycetota bacterium]|nr:RES family NAD+ phosphorylase [Actinomycetota bacterium]
MVKLPDPPEADALADLEMVELPQGGLWWRVYPAGGTHPGAWDGFRDFGPTSARFDHQEPPAHVDGRRLVAYEGALGALCLAERFEEHRRILRRAGGPRLCAFRLAAPLEVVDLRDLWPTRAGASQALSSGSRPRSRAWARAIYGASGGTAAGLSCRSSMYGGETAVVLWEAARAALPGVPTIDLALSDPRLTGVLLRAATSIGYHLAA